MSKKRGRPYGCPALAELKIGEALVVATSEDAIKAHTTGRNLFKKHGVCFEATPIENSTSTEFRRVA